MTTREHVEAMTQYVIATRQPRQGAPWVPTHADMPDSVAHARREYERGTIELATMIGPDRVERLVRIKRRVPAPKRKWFTRNDTEATARNPHRRAA